MSYSAEEREAYIYSDDDGDSWNAYALRPKVITKLRKAGFKPTKVTEDGAHYYENIQFECISFRKPNKREYTPEQKAKMRENAIKMQKARSNKKSND